MLLPLSRAYVVSLARHQQRLAQFQADFAPAIAGGVIPAPVVYTAVDAAQTGAPLGWVYRQSHPYQFYRGLGAWGCYRSHATLVESLLSQCLSGPTLILEDDAFPINGFAEALAGFVTALPTDWDMVYLGGEHLAAPLVVNEAVLRCCGASRSHAYIVRGQECLRRLYQVLSDWRAWPNTWYADHAMTSLQMDGRWNIYAPAQWLIGQRGGFSECTLNAVPDRFWKADD